MSQREVQYDPQTLHGTHYTEADFDAEVESRLQDVLDDEEDGLDQREIDNWRYNIRQAVYREWNRCDDDQVVRFEMANSMKHRGVAVSGYVNEGNAGDNPLLAPIHGISLRDYAAIALKMGQGVNQADVLKAIGIEQPVWEEANTLWITRMQEDASFTVSVLYGQYFMEGVTHPKLENLGTQAGAADNANLEKLKTDRYFYEELCGARQAAYEYGLDGAQWILDNYGITLGDFQALAMQWMTGSNQNWNGDEISHFFDYQQAKQKEYAARFAAEQGGNIADDVEF